MQGFSLPMRSIETTSVVGPFFWSAQDYDDDDPHMRKQLPAPW